MNKKKILISLTCMSVILTLLVFPVQAQKSKPVQLSWISFVPKTNVLTKNF